MIAELTEREKCSQRKCWRNWDSIRRQKKRVTRHLHPAPPEDDAVFNNLQVVKPEDAVKK